MKGRKSKGKGVESSLFLRNSSFFNHTSSKKLLFFNHASFLKELFSLNHASFLKKLFFFNHVSF